MEGGTSADKEPETFESTILGPEVAVPPWAELLLRDFAVCRRVQVSTKARAPRGALRADDVVAVAPSNTLGRVRLLLKTSYTATPPRFWAVIQPFQIVGGVWRDEAEPAIVADLSVVSAPMAYCIVEGRVYV